MQAVFGYRQGNVRPRRTADFNLLNAQFPQTTACKLPKRSPASKLLSYDLPAPLNWVDITFLFLTRLWYVRRTTGINIGSLFFFCMLTTLFTPKSLYRIPSRTQTELLSIQIIAISTVFRYNSVLKSEWWELVETLSDFPL